MCPWVSTVWWTLPCVGNASCFGYSFENRVKNHFFPWPGPLLSKPQSMWGISDTIQGKPVSPHTSHLGEGASEWKKLKHRQNLRFPFTPLRAHSLAPDTANAPPFELWTNPPLGSGFSTSPHLASPPPAFPQNYYYSQNQNSLWGWESARRSHHPEVEI